VFDALFRTASKTLSAFARSRLGATAGATLVLHTWTRKLEFHPHVHAIVTGGGLSIDAASWKKAHRAFLFPVGAMSKVFRAKMIAALRHAYRQRKDIARFDDFQDPEGFARLASAVARVRWYVYAKASFARGRYVLDYLGRYTHRVGLANSRFLAVTPSAVTFRTKGGATTTVDPVTLLRRFIQHVLPKGFHKIRHVGLYASQAKQKEKRARVRALLGQRSVRARRRTWREILLALTGKDVAVCPVCGAELVAVSLPAVPQARAPPARAA
jgi:hypothetical protein